MKSVGIIGQGRFGQLLKKILCDDFTVFTYDKKEPNQHTLAEVIAQETIFIATPIRAFKSVITEIAHKLTDNALVIDVCSVKVYPCQVMQNLLPQHVDIIGTHPLFGPDSYQKKEHAKIILASIRDQQQRYSYWKHFFSEKQLDVIELSPEEHDQFMANSQSLTHLIGRALSEIDACSNGIDTQGYQQLLKIMEHTCNDSWELFYDLQCYNPYANVQNRKFLYALQSLVKKIEEDISKKN